MNEDTLVKTMPLPYGQEWLWIADANMVILSPCLDEVGRERALCEVSAHWRRSCLRLVDGGDMPSRVARLLDTKPLSLEAVAVATGNHTGSSA